MSEKNYGDNSQLAEFMKYISDNMKVPILGAGGGFAPIGTVNAYMGTTAPQGWLVCNGQTVNIADYPELATHFASHFGSANFFGGDGITTFAVPDTTDITSATLENGVFCIKATVAGDPNGHVYSTDEQVVGQDENGNDVYETTINGTTPSASGAASISVGNNVSKCRIVEGYATESGGFNMPNGYSGSGDEFNVAVKDDGTSLYFAISSGFQSKPYRIVVRYIKTS